MAHRTHTLESFGVPYEITGAATQWRAAVPPQTKTSRRTPLRRYAIERDGEGLRLLLDGAELGHALDGRALSDLLEGDLALFVASHAPDRIFVHAGVVGWQGAALLVPGRTMSGKSTLIAALVALGATYYSDEYAVLDDQGRVHAYPRRLSLRQRRGLPLRVAPARVGKKALRVAWVIGTRYEKGATLRLEALTAGRAVLLLLDNAVAARVVPGRVLATLARVTETATAFSGVRGAAQGAARQLLSRCTAEDAMIRAVGRKR